MPTSLILLSEPWRARTSDPLIKKTHQDIENTEEKCLMPCKLVHVAADFTHLRTLCAPEKRLGYFYLVNLQRSRL